MAQQMEPSKTNHIKQKKLLIQLSPTGRGKYVLKIFSAVCAVSSAILPFINNIVSHFIDTKEIIFSNTSGFRQLDLDAVIFYFSMPIGTILIIFSVFIRTYKWCYYLVLLSCYLQLFLLINFVVFDKNLYYTAHICTVILFLLGLFILKQADKYYRYISKIDEFNEKTINRYSSVILKENDDEI